MSLLVNNKHSRSIPGITTRLCRERPGIDPSGWTCDGLKEKADGRLLLWPPFIFFFLTVVPRLLNSCVNGAILTASLQNLTPRAFQSAKSSLWHKWECDYATNHSDSRTVITTQRATFTSSSEGGGTIALRAANRTSTLKTRIILIFPHNNVKSQQLCLGLKSSRIALKTSCCHVSLMVTMQYSTIIQ